MEPKIAMQIKEKKAQVISLVSGKGGVGKTAICGSLGFLLSHLEYKVLLVDTDLGTHGLTYFFIDQVQTSQATDLVELTIFNEDDYPSAIERLKLAQINEHLQLVPSISQFSESENWSDIEKRTERLFSPKIKSVLSVIVEKYQTSYDFIILDAQAGAVPSTRACIELSDIVVMIMEADPVGMWAVRTLERQFASAYRARTQTYYLANKLFFEEVAQYKAITDYMRVFLHLPPLPFDFEVRRAFARRQIPIQFDEPTAFVFAMLRLVKDLIPSSIDRIKGIEDNLSEKVISPLQDEINEITKQINDKRSFPTVSKRISMIILSSLILSFFITFFENELIRILLSNAGSILISIVSIFISIALFLLYSQLINKNNEINIKEVDDLMTRRRSLETILHTRKEELLFGGDNQDMSTSRMRSKQP